MSDKDKDKAYTQVSDLIKKTSEPFGKWYDLLVLIVMQGITDKLSINPAGSEETQIEILGLTLAALIVGQQCLETFPEEFRASITMLANEAKEHMDNGLITNDLPPLTSFGPTGQA